MTDIIVTAPFDDCEISSVPNATKQDVERAMTIGHALYRNRDSWLPKPKRIEILQRTATLIKERRNDLARLLRLIVLQMGLKIVWRSCVLKVDELYP